MLVIYSPQLENPPRDKDVSLGFSLITGEVGSTKYVELKAGVNRDIDADLWDKIKVMPLVPELIEIGAIRVEEDVEVISEAPVAKGGLANKAVKVSLDLINKSFDLELLKEWDMAENRVRVKNAIARRIKQLTEGDG
jgi:hypothetical protein|tara:strand:+ start:173 stop:583 length:411 start_codon:yes stop_codon:yes gene_type:complete